MIFRRVIPGGHQLSQQLPSASLLSNVRRLHVFSTSRPEIVIGGNSALFGVFASLLKHGRSAHKQLTVFRTPIWLDTILPEYYGENWGQTIWGLPKLARELFLRLYPEYGKEEYQRKLITWGQYIELRAYVVHLLMKEFQVPLYDGNVEIQKLEGHGFSIRIVGTSEKFTVPENSFFYNWHRVNKLQDLNVMLPNRLHTDLYANPRRLAPKNIIVLGAGLSTVWLERHFKNSRIICLKRPEDILPRTPATEDVDYSRIELLNRNKITLSLLNVTGAVRISSAELPGPVDGEFYSAIGFSPAKIQKGVVSDANIENLPTDYPRFISDQTNPEGGLMQSLLMWVELTGNLEWAFEPMAYHVGKFPDLLRQFANNQGVRLTDDFFANLEDAVVKLPHSVTEDGAFVELERVFLHTIARDSNLDFKQQSESFKRVVHEMRKSSFSLSGVDKVDSVVPTLKRRRP